MKLGFLGAGKMAEGVLTASLKAGVLPEDVVMAEKSPSRANEMAAKYGVKTTSGCRNAVIDADIVFLAVRPGDVKAVADEIAGAFDGCEKTILASIVAGKSIATLKSLFGEKIRIVRVMPNLALRCGEGASACCGDGAAEIVKILSQAGKAIELEERHFDAVTALSGSGPAFFAYMLQSMAEGGEKLGIPSDASLALAMQTMFGTAKFLRENPDIDVSSFIKAVATPGGTTAAGMNVLWNCDFAIKVAETLAAARNRSAELGQLH